MPDFISNSSFKINDPNGASDFQWTEDGHLQVPIQRVIQLSGLDLNDQIQVVDVNEALDNNGNLKENYVEEEIEIDIELDVNQTPITTQTFKFYYKYIEEERRYDDYLKVNVALAVGDSFCDNLNQLEYRTLYVKQSDLNETQKNLLKNEGKVFNETIYSTDRGKLWNGKLNDGGLADYVFFTTSTEFESDSKKYYPVFKSKPDFDTGITDPKYKFSAAQNSCPVRPEVTEVELFISANMGNRDRTREAICDGVLSTQPGVARRSKITAYIQGDPNDISGKALYQEDGTNPIDPRAFSVSSPFGLSQASIIRLTGEDQPYYLIEYIEFSVEKNGARVAENPIGSCKITNTEPTDCEKFENNIAPTNPNETIVCREVEYSWNGFAWNPTTKPDIGDGGDGNGSGGSGNGSGGSGNGGDGDNVGDTDGGTKGSTGSPGPI
jgi:hypothetical protein